MMNGFILDVLALVMLSEMKQLLLSFIIHASLITYILGEPSCPIFEDLRIHREISQKGFHRDLTTVLQVGHSQQEGTPPEFLLKETFPVDLYVDQYQLADAEAFGGPQTIVPDDIDVERPASRSQGFSFFTYVSPEGGVQDQDTLSITLPIHLRYQRPEEDGGRHTSALLHPVLAVKCAGSPSEATDTDQYLSVPCNTSRMEPLCLWKVLTYQISTSPLEMSVPIGRGSDLIVVVGVTLSVVVSCTVMLLYGMFTNHERQH